MRKHYVWRKPAWVAPGAALLAQPHGQALGAGDVAVHVVDEDVVVAGGLHLDKMQLFMLRTHVVDVHQLGVLLAVAAQP